MNLTHNSQQAYSMTAGALNDIAAGQVAAQAARSNSPIYQANGLKLVADLQANAQEHRNQALLQGNQYKESTLQIQQMERAQQALDNYMKTGQDSPLAPGYLDRLARTVRTINPDGTLGPTTLALDKETADQFRKDNVESQSLDRQLSGLYSLARENPNGGWWFSNARNALNVAKEGLSTQLSKLYGLNRLTEVEYKNYLSQLNKVGNPLSSANEGLQQIQSLKNINQIVTQARNQQLLGR